MYFDYCDMDPMDYSLDNYDATMAAIAKKATEEMAIQKMVSRLLAIKNDKASCEASEIIYERYKSLMFLTDMDPEEYRNWVRNAMFDFNFLKEYESDREDIHIRLIDKCLCVKHKRKTKQIERKIKRRRKKIKREINPSLFFVIYSPRSMAFASLIAPSMVVILNSSTIFSDFIQI